MDNENLNLELYNLPITVNLDTICKYHKAANFTLKNLKVDKSATQYLATVSIVLGTLSESELHSAYNFLNLTEENISQQDSHNLLYLVKSLIDWEWRLFEENMLNGNPQRDAFLPDNKSDELFSIYEIIKKDLDDLRTLLEMRDGLNNDISLNKTPSIQIRYNSTFKEKLKETQLHLNITNPQLLNEFGDILINHYFKNLKDNYSYFYPCNVELVTQLSKMVFPTYEVLIKLEQSLFPDSIKIFKAKTLFKKLVCQKVIDYLNYENIILTPKGVSDGTQPQSEIIYSLLCLFNLIEASQILKHPDLRERSKYIRSILHPTKKKSKQGKETLDAFPEIDFLISDNLLT